ncbi:MAG: radical SAM protein [Nanoarchaeota archaeon]
MAALKYQNLAFSEKDGKVRVLFLKIYYFYLEKKDLERIGKFKVNRHSINFKTNKKESNVKQKFEFLLTDGFNNLVSTINNKPTLYVHRNSGIPLLGSNDFGIIDRGTNTIEIKPITTCNIDCIFCSVDHLKRNSDIVVETDYLIEELKKIVEMKENMVNIHIGSQGDSSLYGELVRLVREIRKIRKVRAISMVTNGILINKPIVDKLIKAGMSHFHVSLHSTDQERASKLANAPYPVKKVMETCRYIVKKAHLLLVPVWMAGINDQDVEDVILFGKEIGADLGVQNYLEYSFGKKPVNPMPMKVFYMKIKELEEKLGVNLTTLDSELEFKEDIKIEKPFRKGDIISVEIAAKGRLLNSYLAVSKERVVTVISPDKLQGKIKVKLIRDKDNIFTAIPS